MYEQGYITYDEYTEAVNEELVFVRSETEVATQEIYSYYVEAVIDDVIADLMEVRGVNYETAQTPALLRRLPDLHLHGLRYPGHSRRGV